jgi:nitroreductase
MMNQQKSETWHKIAEYARWAPSPHNTQPSRLKVIDDTHAQVLFVPSRGLYIADPSGRFTEAAFGIFVEICKIAAASLGYRLEYKYRLEDLYKNGDHETPQAIADLTLIPDAGVHDMPAELILKRHTSRLPYNNRKVPEATVKELQAEAERWGHRMFVRSDKEAIRWVVELNQASLFNDLEDVPTREELKKWLRYSKREAHTKRDGLSAECMHLPGGLMHSFFYHHRIWTMPGLKQLVGWVYGRTMRGIANIAWIQGPFVTMEDRVRTGHLLIRLWLILTQHGVYLHPYGSVITNDLSRKTMLEKMHIGDEEGGRKMVWLLLRLGYSNEPPHSERLPIEEIVA